METKTILLTLTYLVGAGELILAIYFWATHSKNEIRKVMALLAFSTGMWVIFSVATSYVGQNALTTFYMRLVFIFGILLMTALLHLVLVYPQKIFKLDVFHALLLYLPAALISVIMVFTNTIVESFIGSSTIPGIIMPGPLYSVYNLYLFILYVTCLAILIYRVQRSDGLNKQNLSILIWSVLIGGLPAVFIDLLIPIFMIGVLPNPLYANLGTVIWLGATGYIIIKK